MLCLIRLYHGPSELPDGRRKAHQRPTPIVHAPSFCAILSRLTNPKEGQSQAVSEDLSKQRRNRVLSWIINLSGVLIFALILYLGGVEAWRQIVQADWRYVLAAFLVTLLWNLVAAYRWALIAGQVSAEAAACPYRYYFTYHMIGMLTGQVVPISVGMLGARPVALSLSRGVPLKRAALSVFLDKLFDVLLALLLVIPVALYLVDWITLPLALASMAALTVAGAVAVGWKYESGLRWLARIGSGLARLLSGLPVFGRRLLSRLPQQIDRLATESLIPNALAWRAFALTVLLYALMSVRLFLIAQSLRLDIPWYLLAMGACVTQLTLMFSVTPGSLGFLEGGWAAVLALAGLSADQIVLFLIGRRAFVLVFTALNTLLAFVWIRESPARLFRAVLAASRRPATEATPGGTETAESNDAPEPGSDPRTD
jgi:uncharacterized protein (TIRG00374 family)